MKTFQPADILLPKDKDMTKWAVIACDQFTSSPEYWNRVAETAGDAPSALNLVLPEQYLGTEKEAVHAAAINDTMLKYIEDGVFQVFEHSYIYVERTMFNGTIRKGLVGVIDLDSYDYTPQATTPIRATEKTVIERIPPRVKVRKDAPIELPHVIMLLDDDKKTLIESVAAKKDSLRKVYDFNLMEDGGHITGWLLDGADADEFTAAFEEYEATIDEKYQDIDKPSMVIAIGDGNHSLATAKECYEQLKAANPGADLSNHPARFALAELENIHDDSQEFEAIHRVIVATDAEKLLADLKSDLCSEEKSEFPLETYIGKKQETVYLRKELGELAVGILQPWLDEYLKSNAGEIDYIHDNDELIRLADQENAIGIILPSMEKGQLFRGVIADGSLPRKTFSMGHSREKRYYLEARKITL